MLDDKKLKINHYFELVITGDDVTKAKPDPEIYNEIRRRLGVNLRYTALEDSSPGVNSAKAAGMACIAVPNRFTASQNFSHADIVITSLARDAEILA